MDLVDKLFWTFIVMALLSLASACVVPEDVPDWVKIILISLLVVSILCVVILLFVSIWTS